MARITDADKIEVLNALTIGEYGATIRFTNSADGSSTITFEADDSKREERESLRTFVSGMSDQSEDTAALAPNMISRSDLLAELDARDEKARQTWGEKLALKFTQSFYIDAATSEVVRDVLRGGSMDYNTQVTIREALGQGTKGF